MALGVVSPGEFAEFAGVHCCQKHDMGGKEEEEKGKEEEEPLHGSIRRGRPLISLLKWLLPLLPGKWAPQNPPYRQGNQAMQVSAPLPRLTAQSCQWSRLQSRGSRSEIFLLPWDRAEERCGLAFFVFPLPPHFIWPNPGKRRG